jgi:hypothetical protein
MKILILMKKGMGQIDESLGMMNFTCGILNGVLPPRNSPNHN